MDFSERTLWNNVQRSDCKASRDKLILRYQGIVKSAVAKIGSTLPSHVDRDDLHSAGMIGLIGAVASYQLDRQCSFKTYATLRVRGAIIDSMRANDWAPRSMRSRAREVEAARKALRSEIGREATDSELCQVLGLSEDQLAKHNQSFHRALQTSFDAEFSATDGEGISLAEKLVDDTAENALDAQIAADESDLLRQALRTLTEREQQVIKMHFYQDLSGAQIANILGISAGRVCQNLNEGLAKLAKCNPLERSLAIAV